jgi:hypothetical protein
MKQGQKIHFSTRANIIKLLRETDMTATDIAKRCSVCAATVNAINKKFQIRIHHAGSRSWSVTSYGG